MGNGGSITNRTPYNWKLDRGKCLGDDVCTLYGNSCREYSEEIFVKYKMLLAYEDHSEWDLRSWGDGDSFILRESRNRQHFELVNNSSGRVVDRCPHYGRIEEERQEKEKQERERRRREEEKKRRQQEEQRRREEEKKRRQQEEQRRREEEEKRRQEELERTRRIQQRIEEEKWKRRQQAEQRRREEEDKKRREEEQHQRDEELRRQEELELQLWIEQQIEEEKQERERREEEERHQRDEELRRQEELELQLWIEQQIEEEKQERERREEEERHQRDEELRRQEELELQLWIEQQIEEEKQERERREEEERHQRDEELRRQEELELQLWIEQQIEKEKQERERREEERHQRDEELRRQEELELQLWIEQQIEEEKQERERREEEERHQRDEELRRQEELELQLWIEQQIEEEKQERERREEEERHQRDEELRRQEELELQLWIEQQIEEEKQERERRQHEERRQREEEEKRRQAELEQRRRIQEQMEKENEASRKKLSRAQWSFQEEQNLKERVFQQQQTQVLHQMVEDHAAHIERDELADVRQKFEELLSKYQIKENGPDKTDLEDRMKTLQNELTLDYFREHSNPSWSLWALDQATGYVDLSLTDRFSVLEAVVKVTVEGDLDLEDVPTSGQDKKIEFLLSLQDQLHVANPTLARKVLIHVLSMTSQLSQVGKEILSQILFSNIWTPKEIKLFLGRTVGMDQETVTQILHKVCTYRLSCLPVLSAVDDEDPIEFIQGCITDEVDKDVDTILREMQDKSFPDDILSQLEDILRYVEEELAKHRRVDINETTVKEGKKQIAALDLANPDPDTLKKVLIVLSIAVKKCSTFVTASGEEVQGYFPRLTQLASLLLLLLPQIQDKRGCLLEIGTGEGKTCILAMFAMIQAMHGTAVDIVTSSPLLAIRDQEEWKKLYDLVDVTSSAVPPQHQDKSTFEDQDKRLEEAYKKQIVYSTVSTFAADILKQEFEKKTTRGQRKFECVIVDEVDYMTLDSGVQVTFLSHQTSSLRHVEQVLASIWAMVSACRPIEMFETGEILWATRIQHFHKTVKQVVIGTESEDFSENDLLLLGAKLGFYSQEDTDGLNEAVSETDPEKDSYEGNAMEEIMARVGPEEQFKLLREVETTVGNSVNCYSLVNNKAKLFRDESSHRDPDISMLLLQNGLACEIMSEKSLIERTVEHLKPRIKYSRECALDSMKECEGFIAIPSFLKEYLENQLAVFAENALKAITMTPGREYMIDKEPEANRVGFSGAESHHYDAIIPVDFQASGVLEKNKRWGDGLQQFLEMKHQLAISQLSNVTNYMSNVHFFKRYLRGKGIFGVSGTLGGKAEKAFLERQYKTASYVIPSHRHKKLVELPAVQVRGGNLEWIKLICETAWTVADRGQVVLIICEDVKTANDLRTKMYDQQRRPYEMTMYTISEKHNIEKQTFGQGNIIIATNLGGRGTDIHVQHEVNESGGLFVLLTYFPGSHRVERQVFGRTARKGNPGMVQMILNQDHLEPAYQGHSVETMKQLREEYEVHHLESMEKNELLEIELKEDLFSRFCTFLCDFDKNYSEEEKSDLTQTRLKDVPEFLKTHREKFDYQPALNALKESWALWLIHNEEHISKHDNVITLKEDLTTDLKKTAEHLLHGKTNNFYDFVELGKCRTYMHHINKNESDYGALSYWQKAAESDPFYSAVALYNQAYIKINLQKTNYITEAKRLLEEAKTAVDVYLSESTNTMMFCNFSVTKDFTSHHTDCNLQAQMKARMAVFKSWKGYIENALESLQKIESSQSRAITEDSTVYSLSRDKDPITTKELMVLHEFGLSIVFEVKKKPEFCIDALLCFGLGVLQVAAGFLVCALSAGSASQFGLGLISEGVSDMIDGARGMTQGGFDWAEWAISKAISIGVSLVFGGLGKLNKAFKAVRGGTKGLITGAKSCSTITVKQCFKHATKYAVQELGKQGCAAALNYAVDKGLTALFQTVLKEAFKNKVFSLMVRPGDLDQVLTNFICLGIPKAAIEQGFEDFKIDKGCEKEICQSVLIMTGRIIPDLMMDCTMDDKVLDRLSQVCCAVEQHVGKHKALQLAIKGLNTAKYIKDFAQIFNSVPTEDVINNTFVPQLLKTMNKNLPQEKCDQDGRHQLSDVKRLKDELINKIAESVSDSFVEACSRHMTSVVTRACMSKINHVAGTAVSNVLGRSNTQSFFDNQVYKHHMKQAFQGQNKSLSEADKKDLDGYIKEITDVDRPATALDIHILTQSDALQGKGIKVVTVDKHGKKLSEDYYPGKNSSADDIVLQLRKDSEALQQKEGFLSKASKVIRGEQKSYTGHFELLRPDGSVVPVHSEGQNCLYHAVVQASSKNKADLKQEAASLRNQVKDSIQQNPQRYTAALKLQRGYEAASKSLGKYSITGGARKERDEIREQYQQVLNKIKNKDPNIHDVIKAYNLGLVGAYADVIGVRRENTSANNNTGLVVNADHIPPQDSFKKAYQELARTGKLDEFKQKHPGLSSLIDETGNRGLCREVLAEHHQRALTTGNSSESRRIREKLTEVVLSGDTVKVMKMSLIVANPDMSESLRKDACTYHQPHI
ncbi:uncharacterized protein LOC121654659 isoform X2 [Melanotaenia boesemani]|uniref:uncharacterized protein LOC121654659 isoform X2 n=1 Tax=Melanotaenia boesemani TaxID=1250792 RepID=UPI001C03E383|nr:uncharacterized protein LOC121654659 isoform X2 [Melanotaenia boesemani]